MGVSRKKIEAAIHKGLSLGLGLPAELRIPDRLLPVPSSPGAITKRSLDEGTDVTSFKLENGIAVNYRRSGFERLQCSMVLRARGGRSLEKKAGLLSIGLETMLESGVGGEFPNKEIINEEGEEELPEGYHSLDILEQT